jgi:hypothetical protein
VSLTTPWEAIPFTSTPWTILHIVRYEDTTGEKDPHGNWPVVEEAAVPREIYSLSQFGRRGSSHVVMGAEFQERTATILHLAVPDPRLYNSGDQVILWPEFDDQDNYVPDSGVAYWVDGDPSEERMSPWPELTAGFGGTVKVSRVT